MGHPIIPPDPEIGDPCVVCEGIQYPVGQTPKFIWIHFRHVSICSLPIEPPGVANGWYKLGPNNGCSWSLAQPGWQVDYTAMTFVRHLLMGVHTFAYVSAIVCEHSVASDLTCDMIPLPKGGGGRAFVLFEELAILPHHIAFDLAIAPDEDLLFERGIIEDHIHTIFLRDPKLSINVGIKFDFSEQWQLANIG